MSIPMRSRRIWIAALVGLSLMSFAAGLASAHENNNHGTIKVHDDAVVNPPQRNQPHVSCDFWIEGFNMADDSGHLVFFAWPPTGNREMVTPTGASLNWTGTAEPDGDGYHFLAGPFQLPDGHYRVEAYLDQGHPGNREHFAKTKTFWVNDCKVVTPPPKAPPCPANITATALNNGDVRLDWDAVPNATQYRIYRAVEGEDLTSFTMVGPEVTSFTDTTTEVGVTYTYAVTAVVDGVESKIEDKCKVTVTAIPFFPGMAIGALAVAGSVGAYVMLRRR